MRVTHKVTHFLKCTLHFFKVIYKNTDKTIALYESVNKYLPFIKGARGIR